MLLTRPSCRRCFLSSGRMMSHQPPCADAPQDREKMRGMERRKERREALTATSSFSFEPPLSSPPARKLTSSMSTFAPLRSRQGHRRSLRRPERGGRWRGREVTRYEPLIPFSLPPGGGNDSRAEGCSSLASCRRNFMLEVVLTNAFGEHVNKDTEIVASLVYADNGALVEKSRDDAEPPLLIVCEGLEYPTKSRSLPILRGRALFKLKISQLSSKCDNKLFRIHFSTLHTRKYPFLEASSKPIRCISRGRPSRPLSAIKRTSSATIDEIHLLNNGQGLDRDGKANACSLSHDQSSVACLHPSKFLKEGDRRETHKMVSQSKQARKMVVEAQSVRTESTMSDSDNIDARSSWSGSDRVEAEPFSDAMIFIYCLEGPYERSTFLKGVASSINVDDLITLANEVSLYSGCSHHRNQILISKQLLEEGAETWSAISKNKERALWSSAVAEIMSKFMDIAHSTNRGLSEQGMHRRWLLFLRHHLLVLHWTFEPFHLCNHEWSDLLPEIPRSTQLRTSEVGNEPDSLTPFHGWVHALDLPRLLDVPLPTERSLQSFGLTILCNICPRLHILFSVYMTQLAEFYNKRRR